MRVLFAEDDPTLASIVVDLLNEEMHEVNHVADLGAAYAEMPNGAWDLFIIDVPPRSSSRLDPADEEMLRRLAQHGPVILATGRPWATRLRAEDLGLSAILPKPYDLDNLLNTIERLGPAKK